MYKIFFINEYRSFARSSIFQQALVTKIFMSLGILIGFFQFGALGYLLPVMIPSPSVKFIAIIFIAFYVIDILFKIIFLKPPSGLSFSYLTLPIPKTQLALYSELKIMVHFSSIAMLLFWTPFLSKIYGLSLPFFTWITLAILSIAINSIFIFVFKTSVKLGLKVILICMFLGFSAFLIDYIQVIDVSIIVFQYLNSSRLVLKILFHLGIILSIYVALFQLVKKQLFFQTGESTYTHLGKNRKSYFNMRYEWKLFWRNNRYRNTFFLQTIFIGGNILFQTINLSRNRSEIVASTLIMTGIFLWFLMSLTSFGQFFFKAESAFLPKYLSIPLKIENMLSNKFNFSVVMLMSSAIVISPVILYRPDSWKFILSSLLYHVGITIFLFLHKGTCNKSLFEINGRTMFNYQGADFTLHLADVWIIMNLIFVPLFFYLLSLINFGDFFLVFISICGGVSLLLSEKWKKMIIANFQKRKYDMYSGICEK